MKDISTIIARILLKVAKKEEVDAVSKWENISEENARFVEELESFWNLPVDEKSVNNMEVVRKRLFTRIYATEEVRVKRSRIYYFSRIAAAIVFIVLTSGLSIYIASETNLFYKRNWVEISTEAGQQSKVTLPDGTLVWLNAETILKYRPEKDDRNVILSGEAYFEVTHSANHPFIVEAGNTKIKVLGTKFNVSNYQGSKTTEASLLSGKIVMSVNGDQKEMELIPGEKIIYDADQGVLLKKEVKAQNEILWRQGILIFDNEPFDELVQKLERYYAVTFIYDRNTFKNIHYTGSIDNLNINKVLEFIHLTIPIQYEVENNTIKLNLKK